MSASSRRTIPLKGAREQDVLTGWRQMYCYTDRPGVCRGAKNTYRRRERAAAARELRELARD